MKELMAITARQHGLVTRAQAREVGLSDRMIRYRVATGLLVEVHPGVLQLAGAPHTWEHVHRDTSHVLSTLSAVIERQRRLLDAANL